ncbi:MAG: MMPL family transporter, partial [Bdellovibrionales bacterium]|nr:MMPL family transporter [Bdellovibrionales bacterium]
AQLVVLLVLAIGIDYSLFLISRIREEERGGKDYRSAVVVARSTTGVAILWSGLIVALSLCGLFLMGDTVLASMALVSIISVLVTVLGSVYVLPSILLLLGRRLEFGRLPILGSRKERPLLKSWWLRLSLEFPMRTVLALSVLFAALTYFALQLQLGSTVEPTLLPRTMQSYHAFQHLEREFPDFAGIDFSVIVWGDRVDEHEDEGEFDEFYDVLNSYDSVRGPIYTEYSEDGSLLRMHFVALGWGNNPVNLNLIHDLRGEVFPKYFEPLGLSASVSGTLPFVVDDIDRYTQRTPTVFSVVLLLSLTFLLVAFRSIVVPIKAIVLNILSTLAAFGVLVLAFQKSGVPGWSFEVIESFVPPLLFSILFGLSMDYHVFLMSRVNEEFLRGKDTKAAVRSGIESTFRTITGAALIMVSVFVIIATLELPIMKELGFGLAVAVLLDAT